MSYRPYIYQTLTISFFRRSLPEEQNLGGVGERFCFARHFQWNKPGYKGQTAIGLGQPGGVGEMTLEKG